MVNILFSIIKPVYAQTEHIWSSMMIHGYANLATMNASLASGAIIFHAPTAKTHRIEFMFLSMARTMDNALNVR